MNTLQIDLDQDTSDALASLAASRGTAPADLAAEIVAQYVRTRDLSAQTLNGRSPEDEDAIARRLTGVPIDSIVGLENAGRDSSGPAQPDPMDALVGKYSGDSVNDIDEVVYGR